MFLHYSVDFQLQTSAYFEIHLKLIYTEIIPVQGLKKKKRKRRESKSQGEKRRQKSKKQSFLLVPTSAWFLRAKQCISFWKCLCVKLIHTTSVYQVTIYLHPCFHTRHSAGHRIWRRCPLYCFPCVCWTYLDVFTCPLPPGGCIANF